MEMNISVKRGIKLTILNKNYNIQPLLYIISSCYEYPFNHKYHSNPKRIIKHTLLGVFSSNKTHQNSIIFFPSSGTYSMDIANKIVKHLHNVKLSLLVTKQTERNFHQQHRPVNIKLSLLVTTY